jgi:hypothetical protein
MAPGHRRENRRPSGLMFSNSRSQRSVTDAIAFASPAQSRSTEAAYMTLGPARTSPRWSVDKGACPPSPPR